MAIQRIGTRVFSQTPIDQAQFKGTSGTSYFNTFLARNDETWELALKQAAAESSTESESAEAQAKVLAARTAAIERRRAQYEKAIASLNSGELKATDAAIKTSGAAEDAWALAGAKESGGRAASSKSSMAVTGTQSSSSSSSGGREEGFNFLNSLLNNSSATSPLTPEEQEKTARQQEIVQEETAKNVAGTNDDGVVYGEAAAQEKAVKEVREYLQSKPELAGDLELFNKSTNYKQAAPESWLGFVRNSESTKAPFAKGTTSSESARPGTRTYPNLPSERPGASADNFQVASREAEISRIQGLIKELDDAQVSGPLTAASRERVDTLTRAREIYNRTRMGARPGSAAVGGGAVGASGATPSFFSQQTPEMQALIVEDYSRRKSAVADPFADVPESVQRETPYKTDYRRLPEGTREALEGAKLNRGGPSGPMGTGEIAPDPERRDPEFGLTNPDSSYDMGDPAALSPGQRAERQAAVQAAGDLGERSPYPEEPQLQTLPQVGEPEGDVRILPKRTGEPAGRLEELVTPSSSGVSVEEGTSGGRGVTESLPVELQKRRNAAEVKANLQQLAIDRDRDRRRQEELDILFPEGGAPRSPVTAPRSAPRTETGELQALPDIQRAPETMTVPDTSLDYNEEQLVWHEKRQVSFNKEFELYNKAMAEWRSSTPERRRSMPIPKAPEFGRPPERGPKAPKPPPQQVPKLETKEEHGTRMKYVMQRHAAARERLKKADKFKRLTRSGIGKLTKELYIANKNANKPINESWDTLALTYATYPADMQTAHEILLALDIEANANPTPKE